MNGRIYFIEGNHDSRWYGKIKNFEYLPPIYELKHNKQLYVLSHYPLREWNKSFYASYHTFGHCLDEETEILTEAGWKSHLTISSSDLVCTMNIETNAFEFNDIKDIIKYSYTGDVVNIKSKGLDLNITDEHVLVFKNKRTNKNYKELAKELISSKRKTFIKSGLMKRGGVNISDNYLRLLVWIASDGSLHNSSLVRIKLEKTRKIKRLESLLESMNLPYRKIIKEDYVSFNFNLIKEDFNLSSLKPLPKELLNCNKNQLEVILEEYSHTDGKMYNDTLCIWTSKKEEVDLLQSMCITNEYQCNYDKRIGHGFSKKPNYTLSITKGITRDVTDTSKKSFSQHVEDKLYWCVKVKNGTIIVRRNGKPVVVGNCHGNLAPRGLSFDIGVDCWDGYPVSIEEVNERMESLKYEQSDV